MGKISKSAKVSKALVKRGISKSLVRADNKASEIEREDVMESKVSSEPANLKEISKMIASAPISRGKRKRAIKKARLEGRKAFAAFAIASKKSTDDIRSLGEALGNFKDMFDAIQTTENINVTEPSEEETVTKVTKKLGGALKRNKKRQADFVDIQRVQALFQIPEFSADPLSAMEKHLRNLKAKKEEKAGHATPNRMEVS